MPHPPEYYIELRNKYTHEYINIIFLLESPPASGNYFYNNEGSVSEPLYSAFMDYLKIIARTKEEGLKEFCKRGYLLVDATYIPVNNIANNTERNRIIMQNYENLKTDLKNIDALNNRTPIILVKANIYELFINQLPTDGFNIVNGQTKIPFPSTGQQSKFKIKIKELMEIEIINNLLADAELRKHYLPYNIPKAYCNNVKNIKAFILGADPSNFSDSERQK